MKKNIILSIIIMMLSASVSVSAVEPSKEELLKRIEQLEEQVSKCNLSKEEKYIIPFTKVEDKFNNLARNIEENYEAPQSYKSDVPTWLLK